MMSSLLIPLLASTAAGQYATITDLLGKDGHGNSGTQGTTIQPFDSHAATKEHSGKGSKPHGWSATVTPQPTNAPLQANAAMNGMSSLLGAMQGSGASSASSPSTGFGGNQPINGEVLSQDSEAVVSGLVEAFMHKVQLEDGEKACLENNLRTLTGDVMGTVGDIVTAVKALIAGRGTIANGSSGSLVSAGLDSAMKLTSLVTLSTQLMKTCVHGDALDLLEGVGHHLTNGTYLEHRFLVNGVDIAHDLSDAIIAFEGHNFHRFGTDVGTSLRKILLSKATNATRLPEGVPEEKIIQEATDGLMRGFFVSGVAVEITDTARPDVDIKINLHECISGNSQFFKELWMSAWDLIAELSAVGAHGLNMKSNKWSGELMKAMLEFPMALEKCGVSPSMQTMLMEAIKTLNDLKVEVHFPHDQMKTHQAAWVLKTDQAAEKMAQAVEAWTNWDFEQFGYELGKLFRELVMLAFPEKYSVDASGRLKRYSSGEAQRPGIWTVTAVGATAITGGAAVSFFVAVAAIRTRSMRTSLLLPVYHDASLVDIEDCDSGAMIE